MTPMLLLAAEASSSQTSVVAVFLQYGAVGAMLVVLGFFARSLIQREQKRGDRLELELSKKNDEVRDTLKLIMDPLTQMTNLSKVMVEKNAQMQAIIDLYERQKRNDR